MQEGDRPEVYSNGIAIIFLCELDARRYLTEINYYLDVLMKRQKPHGGWGYDGRETGDTSQTQYAALAIWEANRYGFQIEGGAITRLIDWLMRTQDPDGSWAYQGNLGSSDRSAPQEEREKSVVMLSAGLGSVLICHDLMNGSGAFDAGASDEAELPPALRAPSGQRPVDRHQTTLEPHSDKEFQ